MANGPAKAVADEAPATVPQTTPAAIGYGHPEYQFVQAIMEMQKSIGEVKASVDGLRSVVEGTKSKVDDLVNWKNKIIGSVAVLTFFLTLTWLIITKFWDYVTIKSPVAQSQTDVVIRPPQTTPAIPPK